MLTGKQLQAYLAYQIHGRKEKTPRKPPAKARQSTRRGPVRSDEYRAFVRSHCCVACGSSYQIEAAHTSIVDAPDQRGGMSQKSADYSCIPLCRDCHTQAACAYHRVGERVFAKRHRLNLRAIVARLREEWELHTLPKRKSA